MTPAPSAAALALGAIVAIVAAPVHTQSIPEADRVIKLANQARGQIGRGATPQMTRESSDVEVEGRLTGELSVPGSVRLAFETGGGMAGLHRWTTPLHADGSYRVTLAAIDRDDQICIRAEPSGLNGHEPAEPIGGVLIKCAHFANGLQRLDIDEVHLPRGIVRIEVPPVDDAGVADVAALTVSIAGTPGSSTLRGFKLVRGLQAEYFSDFREREFAVTTHDRQTTLASSRVTLSSARPVRLVTLAVASGR
jgi:hypothetical protein